MSFDSGTEVAWGIAARTDNGTVQISTNIPSSVGLIHIDEDVPLAEVHDWLQRSRLRLETDPRKADVGAPITILGPHPEAL